MELPITEKEFQKIIELLKNRDTQLYNKLWSYKLNRIKTMDRQ
jgi:hypothetical protein